MAWSLLLSALVLSTSAFAQDIEIDHGGLKRVAALHYPLLPRLSYPTVIGLHGGGGNREELLVDAKLQQYANAQGMLLVLPEGTGPKFPSGKTAGSWNAGRCCGPAVEQNVDDVGFLRALIDTLVTRHRADPKRIYVTGFSNGGKMAYRAACELSDKIAAIGTVGAIGVFDSAPGVHDHCPRKRLVPTIHIHGGEDRCSPAAGGDVGNCFDEFLARLTGDPQPDGGIHVSLEPASSFFHYWSTSGGLSHSRTEYPFPGQVCLAYGTGPLAPRATRYCHLSGVGHVWPGGTYGVPCQLGAFSLACQAWRETVAGSADGVFAPYALYDTSQRILEFFSQFRLN